MNDQRRTLPCIVEMSYLAPFISRDTSKYLMFYRLWPNRPAEEFPNRKVTAKVWRDLPSSSKIVRANKALIISSSVRIWTQNEERNTIKGWFGRESVKRRSLCSSKGPEMHYSTSISYSARHENKFTARERNSWLGWRYRRKLLCQFAANK